MKIALTVEKQFHQKPKPQERLHSSLPWPEQLTLEDISPIWASRLKKENLPTFMSSRWLQWRSELRKTSKCVVGEAYGYSSRYMYGCDDCDKIGCKFLYYFMLNWRRKLESNKKDFVRHCNEKHAQQIYMSKNIRPFTIRDLAGS
jgi:hypothetical protein